MLNKGENAKKQSRIFTGIENTLFSLSFNILTAETGNPDWTSGIVIT